MTKAEFKKRVQIITAVCIVVLLAAIIIVVGQLVSMISLNNKEAALQEELRKTKIERTLMEEELEYRQSLSYAEQYAREVLGRVKPGEEIYIIDEE